MRVNFTESTHCRSGRHCLACRSSRTFRASLTQAFELPHSDVDFVCPHGRGAVATDMTPSPAKPCGCKKAGERRGLGDKVAAVTNAVGLKSCSTCKRRQAWLNQLGCRISRALHRLVDWLILCPYASSGNSDSEGSA